MELTPAHLVVLAVYEDLAPLGGQGAGRAQGHVTAMLEHVMTGDLAQLLRENGSMTLDVFSHVAAILESAGLLSKTGHASYPLYTITPEGREALRSAMDPVKVAQGDG